MVRTSAQDSLPGSLSPRQGNEGSRSWKALAPVALRRRRLVLPAEGPIDPDQLTDRYAR